MLPYLVQFYSRVVTRFVPQIFIPFGIVVGFIGYNIEGLLSDRHTPSIPAAKDEREERMNTDELQTDIGSLKDKKFVPKTVFEKNLNPSLIDNPKK